MFILYLLGCRVVKLPETDGSFAERPSYASYTVQHRTTEVPGSNFCEIFLRKKHCFGNCCHVFTQTTLLTSSTVTPSAVCWTPTSEIYVGCVEGFLLHVDPENLSVSILYNPKGIRNLVAFVELVKLIAIFFSSW